MARTGPISYSLILAEEATGIEVSAMREAIRKGTLRAKRQPKPDGTPNPRGKFVVTREELEAWVDGMPDA